MRRKETTRAGTAVATKVEAKEVATAMEVARAAEQARRRSRVRESDFRQS